MAEAKEINGRKIKSTKTFKLKEVDQHILTNLGTAVEMAQDALRLAKFNVTNYMGMLTIERWDYPEGIDISFSDVSVTDGDVTVNELEPADDPKDPGAAASSDGNGTSATAVSEPTVAKATQRAKTKGHASADKPVV